jgi:hypothetical protein
MINNLSKLFKIDTSLLVEEFQSFQEILRCSVCYNIPFKPGCCNECRSLLCHECINSWLEINESCPMCRYPFVNRSLDRLSKEFMSKIKLHCPFKEEGCSENIKYDSFINHIEECKYVIYTCENCGKKGNLPEIKQHSCNILCNFCSEWIDYKDQDEHMIKCLENNLCKFCNKYLSSRDMKYHIINECLRVDAKCKICGELGIRKSLIDSHDIKYCLDKMLEKYKNKEETKKQKYDEWYESYFNNNRKRVQQFKCVSIIRQMFDK